MNALNSTTPASPTGDRFTSLEFLASDLENLCQKALDDPETTRRSLVHLKAWRDRFERELLGLERALGETNPGRNDS